MKLKYADNFITTLPNGIPDPYSTTVTLAAGEVARLISLLTLNDVNAQNAGTWGVPVSLVDAAGLPVTSYGLAVCGYITGWDTSVGDDVNLLWLMGPDATVAAGAKLAIRHTARALDMQAQPVLHDEGAAVQTMDIQVLPGGASYVYINEDSINISMDVSMQNNNLKTTAPARLYVDNSSARIGITVSVHVHSWGSIRWKDGVTPSFTSGNQCLVINVYWVSGYGVIGEWAIYS